MTYRTSKYINFDTGDVTLAPMDFKNSMTPPWTTPQKLDLFECRVDVWTLGVMVAMLRDASRNRCSPEAFNLAARRVWHANGVFHVF